MVSNLNISDIKSYAIEKRKEFIDYYWLGLGDVNKIKTTNKIAAHELFKENPMLAVIDLMRKPENFAWTCKVLFNKIIAPYQAVILKELWNHPFPLLIGSRGLSKSFCLALYALLKALFNPGSKIILTGAAFRQAKIIFNYCETIWKESRMLQDILSFDKSNRPLHGTDEHVFKIDSSQIIAIPTGTGENIRGKRGNCLHPDTLIETEMGLMRIDDYYNNINLNYKLFTGDESLSLEKPDYFIVTKPMECYKISVMGGYDFICSNSHQVKTVDGWKLACNLNTDDKLIFVNNYKFPDNNIVIDDVELDEDLAWLFGLLVSEGEINKYGSMNIRMVDKVCIDKIEECWNRLSNKYNWNLNICRYINKERDDKRGWRSQTSYNVNVSNIKIRNLFVKFGLDKVKSRNKRIPSAILMSPKSVVIKFLSGLMEGDGTCFHWKDKRSNINLGVAFYSGSEQLAREVHILFSKLDIFSSRCSRNSNLSKNKQYVVRFYGINAIEVYKLLDVDKWKLFNDNYYTGILTKRFNRKALLVKNVVKLPEQLSLRDFSLPITHSFYGNGFIQHNCLIVDEFNSINVQVFEEIMQGFNAVKSNPIQAMIEYHKLLALKDIGEISEDEFLEERSKMSGNQTIISGTCGYTFEHLYKYFKDYHDIITNKDNKVKLEKLFGSDNLGISSKDFSIIRMPYKLIPPGVMDEKTILKAKATSNTSIFQSEFEACFLSDTSGFFKRSLIQKCTCGKSLVPFIKKCGEVEFNILTEGHRDLHYVMGVDPASESDNFAIVILELHEDHRRIVYAWTTNNATHKAKLRYRLIDDNDYYRYCARKIRDLMIQFNIKEISIDAQGGGKAIMEVLGDPKYLVNNEKPLYPIPDLDKPRLSDNLAGLHILRPIEFSNANWVYDANHNLKQDMETTELLFPLCDSLAFGMLHEQDKLENKLKAGVDMEIDKLIETAEDVLLEVEELKNELVIIEHSKTPNGRDRWDTPQIKGLNQKKGRLRKDRYSALLLANASGRAMIARTVEYEYNIFGGFTKDVAKVVKNEKTIGNISMVEEGFSYGGGVSR